MLLQNLRARMSARLSGDREAGFTLIELLVVMLILGILAAIAIPAFFNQRDKATDAEAKSMARSAQTAMETFATESGGVYDAALPAGFATHGELLADIEPTIQADRVTVTDTSPTEFTVTAESDNEGQTFSITRNEDGTTTFDCTVEGEGGCPRGGNWAQ